MVLSARQPRRRAAEIQLDNKEQRVDIDRKEHSIYLSCWRVSVHSELAASRLRQRKNDRRSERRTRLRSPEQCSLREAPAAIRGRAPPGHRTDARKPPMTQEEKSLIT